MYEDWDDPWYSLEVARRADEAEMWEVVHTVEAMYLEAAIDHDGLEPGYDYLEDDLPWGDE